ncbi:glutathione peroxidase [Spirosoma telluris]
MRLSRGGKNGQILTNKQHIAPKVPFYGLTIQQNNGQVLSFKQLKNKKVLLVNTASNCGYTNQFAELQNLYEKYTDKLVIIGFPANNFREQEKSNDAKIAKFCQLNYGVTFLLAQKSSVIKGAEQNPVYQWLTSAEQNGWNTHQPDWNFGKYLVDETGTLTDYFAPAVSPLGTEVISAIQKQTSALPK